MTELIAGSIRTLKIGRGQRFMERMRYFMYRLGQLRAWLRWFLGE